MYRPFPELLFKFLLLCENFHYSKSDRHQSVIWVLLCMRAGLIALAELSMPVFVCGLMSFRLQRRTKKKTREVNSLFMLMVSEVTDTFFKAR